MLNSLTAFLHQTFSTKKLNLNFALYKMYSLQSEFLSRIGCYVHMQHVCPPCDALGRIPVYLMEVLN